MRPDGARGNKKAPETVAIQSPELLKSALRQPEATTFSISACNGVNMMPTAP